MNATNIWTSRIEAILAEHEIMTGMYVITHMDLCELAREHGWSTSSMKHAAYWGPSNPAGKAARALGFSLSLIHI